MNAGASPVPTLFLSRARSTVALLALAAAGCLGAAEDTVRYSARPALAEIVLGGREVPVTVDSKGDSIGDTNYRGLSLLPGELPLTIGMSAK